MPSVERPPRDWSARIATLEASPDALKAALGGGGSGAIETPEQNVRVRPVEVHGDPLDDDDDDDDAGGRGADDDDEVFVRSAGEGREREEARHGGVGAGPFGLLARRRQGGVGGGGEACAAQGEGRDPDEDAARAREDGPADVGTEVDPADHLDDARVHT